MVEVGRLALAFTTLDCRGVGEYSAAARAGVLIMRQVCQTGAAQATRQISLTTTETTVAKSGTEKIIF